MEQPTSLINPNWRPTNLINPNWQSASIHPLRHLFLDEWDFRTFEDKNPSGFIYILEQSEMMPGYVKLGRTCGYNMIHTRYSTPYPKHQSYAFLVPYPVSTESDLLQLASKFKYAGEIFKMSREQAIDLCYQTQLHSMNFYLRANFTFADYRIIFGQTKDRCTVTALIPVKEGDLKQEIWLRFALFKIGLIPRDKIETVLTAIRLGLPNLY